MKVTFTLGAMRILDKFVRLPHILDLSLIDNRIKYWCAKDIVGARQIISLQKLLEEKILTKESNSQYRIPDSWTGFLPRLYVDRLLEITKHYEQLGLMPSFSRDYIELLDCLEGKTGDSTTDELFSYKEEVNG